MITADYCIPSPLTLRVRLVGAVLREVLDVVLEEEDVARDALDRRQHVVLQRQRPALRHCLKRGEGREI